MFCPHHHSSRPLPPPHHHTHTEAILARYTEAGEEARVVVPDLRGINASFAASDPPAAFDYWALVNDTAALVTGAAGGPAHVVAEGLGGGTLGWGLAHRFPAKVRSLYSIASPHPGEKTRPPILTLCCVPDLNRDIPHHDHDHWQPSFPTCWTAMTSSSTAPSTCAC